MYCTKCGTKNNDNDKFCIKCGNVLVSKKTNYFDLKKAKKKINKYEKKLKDIYNKNKRRITIGIGIIILLFLYAIINNLCFSEDVIIKKYIYAYENNDYATVINLSDIDKNEFMSNKSIERKYGSIENNKITIKTITTNNTNSVHNRTVLYEKNGITTSKTLKIEKKLFGNLIFSKYIISSDDLTAYNVKVSIPSDATLYIDDVKIKDKYLDSSNKDENTNIYKIPSLLKKDVKITIKLNNGLELSNTKSVYNDEAINYKNLSYNDMDSNNFNKIIKKIKNELTEIITDALNNKDKEDDYEYKSEYDYLKNRLKNSNVTNFNIKKIKLNNVSLSSDNITLRLSMEYKYKDKNKKDHEKSRSIMVSLDNGLEIDKLYLYNIYYIF